MRAICSTETSAKAALVSRGVSARSTIHSWGIFSRVGRGYWDYRRRTWRFRSRRRRAEVEGEGRVVIPAVSSTTSYGRCRAGASRWRHDDSEGTVRSRGGGQ